MCSGGGCPEVVLGGSSTVKRKERKMGEKEPTGWVGWGRWVMNVGPYFFSFIFEFIITITTLN